MAIYPFPLKFITCVFGTKDANHPTPHRGTDFGVVLGTPIPSATAGQVIVSKWSDVLGWVVVVKYNRLAYFGYCHLKEHGAPVGKVIAEGDIIGHVGSTGSASTGPHLHFTFSRIKTGVFAGQVLDPIRVIARIIAKKGK